MPLIQAWMFQQGWNALTRNFRVEKQSLSLKTCFTWKLLPNLFYKRALSLFFLWKWCWNRDEVRVPWGFMGVWPQHFSSFPTMEIPPGSEQTPSRALRQKPCPRRFCFLCFLSADLAQKLMVLQIPAISIWPNFDSGFEQGKYWCTTVCAALSWKMH